MNDTLQYYNEHAAEFVQDTQNSDMHEKYEPFLSRVVLGGHILDLGCGSGRDSAEFIKRGYQVTAMDGSEQLCRIAEAYIGQQVHHMYFQDIGWQNAFDGVWACSSLLHCTIAELPEILQKVSDSLKDNGVLYISFKYGDFAGWRNGRYFTNLTEDSTHPAFDANICHRRRTPGQTKRAVAQCHCRKKINCRKRQTS